jgi:hypothetical protein
VGFILLHMRLRSHLSLSFLASIAAISIWALWGSNALDRFIFTGTATDDARALVAIGQSQSVGALIESILMLWFGTSFLLTVGSVRSQHVA